MDRMPVEPYDNGMDDELERCLWFPPVATIPDEKYDEFEDERPLFEKIVKRSW